jgi:hypothetical protein
MASIVPPDFTIPELLPHPAINRADDVLDGSGPEQQGNDMSTKQSTMRMAAAALVVGGTLVLAVPSGAGAATRPAGEKACAAAERRLPVLESRQAKLQAQLTAAQDALTRAEDAGKRAIVNRLEARLENVQLRLDKVGAALDQIHQVCG